MLEKSSGQPEKSSGVRIVTALANEMHVKLVALCGPRSWFENRESWLARGAKIAGITYRAARSCFYKEADYPHVRTVERVRAAHAKQEAIAREEYRKLSALIASIETRMAQGDPDFHSSQAHAMREALRMAGGMDRALDKDEGVK